jgi:hypothetical protein
MPRFFRSRWTPLPRLALMAALALLLCAQFLLLAHAGEHAHGDEGHGHDEPACALCLFQATGHAAAAPLNEPQVITPRPWPRVRPWPQPARLSPQDGWPLRPAARGPPAGQHRA